MKKTLLLLLLMVAVFASCSNYEKLLQSRDYTQRYEAAKQYYYAGSYTKASTLLTDLIAGAKGTDRAEEALFLLGMSAYRDKEYDAAAGYFKKYYETYPRGYYVEEAHFYAGVALYENTPEPELDQSDTYKAITEFQKFTEDYPDSRYRKEATRLIFVMQDKLIEKEYAAAKLYFDLGTYFGTSSSSSSGNNYEACVVTAQNAISDFPYSERREDFAILIVRAKFELAEQSVESKKVERFQNAIDEYHGFVNEYPKSKFLPKATSLYNRAKAFLAKPQNAAQS